ncbi:EamA family transporter [Rhodobacterales bacterium HKCCE2091]|nr:EamA family transporter [Rhodobacterales bacterium HKCCE2091]
MTDAARPAHSAVRTGLALVLFAVLAISVNDMVVKLLSGGYPLHQLVFLRSVVGLCFALVFLRLEGGFPLLRTRRPLLHALRALAIVVANMTYFAAVSVLPLGLATGLFFVAPLFITLLSVPVLGATVGPRRLFAVLLGLLGVAVMVSADVALPTGTSPVVFALPVAAAFCYAVMQVLTSKLGAESRASAMSIYIHVTFLFVSAAMFLVAGDGRFAEGVADESLVFLLRAWTWPAAEDAWLFLVIGGLAGVIGYALSQAYRLGPPAVLAPFEYVALPMAMFWGWQVFGEVPGPRVWIGSALIVGAGVYVFLREGGGDRPAARVGTRR